MNNNPDHIALITSTDFSLMFEYENSASFIGPDSRGYVFEIYANADKDQMIFKEYKPSAWRRVCAKLYLMHLNK
ncbi:MAG: hypothetical protein KKD38_00440 [Candidatus Delongbacteria bacterium]|nr:hypothetical protein [Candidatus Delongbacteria bacterium]